jgi:hypothetical protein
MVGDTTQASVMPHPAPADIPIGEESGQDLAEYGIVLAALATWAALIAVLVAQNLPPRWSNGQNHTSSVVWIEH